MGSSIGFYRTGIDKDVFAELRKRSDLRGLVQALSLLVIFIFTNLVCLYFFLRSAWILMACSMAVHSLFSNFLGMETSVHELSHRTPFRTRWLNEVFYYLFAFITWNNPIHFRESHKRHHQFTLFRGLDREVVIEPAPVGLFDYLSWMSLDWKKFRMIMGANIAFSLGRDRPDVFSWDPLLGKDDPKRKKMFFWARSQLLGHVALAAIFIYLDVWVLIYTVSLSYFFFTFLGNACGAMQHIGLSSNVPDFRICCHTMKFGPVMAFFYWNMNYHIEHHMYASVPFHRLPDLHRTIAHDLPEPVKGFLHGFMHITKLVSRQRRDSQWVHVPQLPATANPARLKVE